MGGRLEQRGWQGWGLSWFGRPIPSLLCLGEPLRRGLTEGTDERAPGAQILQPAEWCTLVNALSPSLQGEPGPMAPKGEWPLSSLWDLLLPQEAWNLGRQRQEQMPSLWGTDRLMMAFGTGIKVS